MKIIECPRDAMQGIDTFIPTDLKVEYLNLLVNVGFDTIDFGSFVSPKAVPQMKDTAEVLSKLDLGSTSSKLLAIVANVKGAEVASGFSKISYLGYPLSLSETFQQRNTNRSISQAFENLADIQSICQKADKQLVVYLSMGFGNPYGDPYGEEIVEEFVASLDKMGIGIISLADTIGSSNSEQITKLFNSLIPKYPHIEFGAHLHSDPMKSSEKIKAAYNGGCRRIEGAIRGYGGCPMAKDDLVGNIATEVILDTIGYPRNINQEILKKAIDKSYEVFGN